MRDEGDVASSPLHIAPGVLDSGYSWDMSVEDAIDLGRRSIYHATHRDAGSGGFINGTHSNFVVWDEGRSRTFAAQCQLGFRDILFPHSLQAGSCGIEVRGARRASSLPTASMREYFGVWIPSARNRETPWF